MFTKDYLIDDNFIDHLTTIILEDYDSSLDRVIVNILRLFKSLNADDDYVSKFMAKINPKLFKPNSNGSIKGVIFNTILDWKALGIDSDDIKRLRMKNAIPDYYDSLISGMSLYLEYTIINKNKQPLTKMYFFNSISLLNEAEVKPFIKEIFDIFQAKNNEEIISIFWKIGEGFVGERNEEVFKVLDYLFPALVDIYSITYTDIMSSINNNTVTKF
jgi:hypothetical protein